MNLPKVAVLLATYNGMPWLPTQLASILDQRDVDVRIIVSDDGSVDETMATLESTAGRIGVLPRRDGEGGAAQNFLYLIAAADIEPDEYVAFCDQDDVWQPDKLARQVLLLNQHDADGASSSIEGLYPDGSTALIRKDYPQRELDFICEAAGPGASYLLSPRAFATVRRDLASGVVDQAKVGFHDWLVYALVRAHGMRWIIDHWPTMQYRQHGTNEMGANRGLGAVKRRFGMLKVGWYREQFILTADACLAVADDFDLKTDMQRVRDLLATPGFAARLKLAPWCWVLRRRVRDRFVLAGTLLGGLW